jgi:SAM-dependent methyltransferase
MSSKHLSKLYRNRFLEKELPRKNAIWKILCKDFFQKYINPSCTIVDVACGYGEFINNIDAKKKIAIDLNIDSKTFLSPQIQFYQCSATEFGSKLTDTADIVFASNFLEHLPDKKTLDLFLDQVLVGLKSGGEFIILGPNLRYLPGQYWDYYDHHLGLTHLSLSEALRMKGFNVKTCIDRFLPFTTKVAYPTHPLLVKVYLMLPIAWRFFGKQFFIVAVKR